jgi:K+-sensing histidine kinase KdpD
MRCGPRNWGAHAARSFKTAQVHHASWQSCRLTARRPRAAAGEATDHRVSWHDHSLTWGPTAGRAHIGRAGIIALAFATWVCFQLGLNSATTSFVYLIVIVLLSLMDSFISSAVFSVIAVGCLNFFFVQPLYSFEVADAQDVTTLVAFLITSLASPAS